MSARFDLDKFLVDVFDPRPGERVAVMVDLPGGSIPDNQGWRERRAMAAEWVEGLEELGSRIGFEVLPLVTYAATGSNNADLPDTCRVGEREMPMDAFFDGVSLVIAMSEFSSTAPLVEVCRRRPGAEVFRAASMPQVQRRMERTALAADYARVAERCRLLKKALEEAVTAETEFSTGHRCLFDLRHRVPESDDGYLHVDKSDDIPVINLPSGESFQVPYEGEKSGQPSRSAGELPVAVEDGVVVFRVEGNRIIEVRGEGEAAERYRSTFRDEPATANVAEVGFGCNERAEVWGNVLEDEKAGFHWAYGRSDHLGGTVGVKRFSRPDRVVHQDIVYAKGSPITVDRVELVTASGERFRVIDGGEYAWQALAERYGA